LNLGLNVRQTELLATKLQGKAPEKHTSESSKSSEIMALEEQLRQYFHTKVAIQPSKKRRQHHNLLLFRRRIQSFIGSIRLE